MIGRGSKRDTPVNTEEPTGFDAFDLRLGDLMRGERATMGKSLLDVQRELKIKAAYIAAIENADPTAFETPGFIAGYVRSYARYLNMDPEWAFQTFCRESGFETAHGMSAAASTVASAREERLKAQQGLGGEYDMFASPTTPFIPSGEAFLSRIEPGAVGSVLVLVALIGGLGYGGWTVLQEVQKVRFAPVEQAPTVVADLDPLAGNGRPAEDTAETGAGRETRVVASNFSAPSAEALSRIYQSEPLDVPIMVPRDGPISTLQAGRSGVLAEMDTRPASLPPTHPGGASGGADPVDRALAAALDGATGPGEQPSATGPGETLTAGALPPSGVQVTETPPPPVQLVAVRDAWVRVTGPDGTVLYEATMRHGDTYVVPQTEEPATLRIGESGAVYFAVNGEHYGPVGNRGAVTSNVALSADALTDRYQVADISADSDLSEVVRVAEAEGLSPGAESE